MAFEEKLPVKHIFTKILQIRCTPCVEKIYLVKIVKADKLLGDLCQVIELSIPGTIATNDVMRSLNRNSSVFDRLSQERWSGGREFGFTPLYLSISQDFNTRAAKRWIKRVVTQKLPIGAMYHESESELHSLDPSFRTYATTC